MFEPNSTKLDTSGRQKMRFLKRAAACAAALVSLAAPFAEAQASGVESTRISLPKGPASIEGLGRSFVPSLASGTAAYGIDLSMPPAVRGFVPKLSLDYDGGSGVSELGSGWRIGGLPSIRRRTNDGLPRFDTTDALEISGLGPPSDLLEVTANTFRPEHESGAFVRVKRSSDGSTWEARDKSGTTWRFGGAGYTESEGSKIATWLLREQLDTFGHSIRYEWDTSEGHALLGRVVFNDFGDASRIVVAFDYEARPDAHVLFASGIRKTLTRRLARVDISVGAQPVRSYELTYGASSPSRLASVTLFGADGVTRMPTLSFEYTEPSFASDGQVVTMKTPPGRSPAETNVELADLNGDGLPDLLVTEPGQYRSYVNHDGKSWLPAENWLGANSPSLALGQTGVQLADLDGDGAIDLVAKSGISDFRYFPGLDATHFSPSVEIATVPNVTFEDPDVRLADMDGDRRIDVVITTSAGIAIGYNLGGTDWTAPKTIGVIDAKQPLRFSDGKTRLCEVNGDGIQDLCHLRSSALTYWLGRGRGIFEPATTASGVPTFDESDPWQLVDLNGDGWVDLAHVGVTNVRLALAVAEGAFDAPRTIDNTPHKQPGTFAGFSDMNGTGTTDVVWVDVTGSPDAAWRYLELFPSGRGGLLARIDNGLGKVTKITYEPSSLHAAQARDAGEPWTARMNVPMPIVARVETDVSLGDPVMVTEYVYRDGTWDPAERTFAGFGAGTEWQLGDEHTPTLVTDSRFDVGLNERVLRGSLLENTARDEKGTIFARTTSDYTAVTLATALDGRGVRYAYKSSERVEHVEGTDFSAARVTLTEWEQDQYGNTVAERRWGEVVGDDKLAGNDEAIMVRTFANNATDWLLGFVATQELTDAGGKRISMSHAYYDGEPFVGLPLGKVSRGQLARTEAWVGPGSDAFELDTATRYDDDGLPVEIRDALGGGRRFVWDPETRASVIEEAVTLDTGELVERQQVDRRFGVPISVTDHAGSTTALSYDALGRIVRVVRPGDSVELPTMRYDYELAAPLSRVVTRALVFSGHDGHDVTYDFVDGAGRKRASVVRHDEEHWVVSGLALLDARGSAWRTLRPRFAAESETELPSLSGDGPGATKWNDALGRSTRTLSNAGIETKVAHAPFVTKHWDGGRTAAGSSYSKLPNLDIVDGLGRLVEATRDLGGEPVRARFEWDAGGRLVAKTDPEGNRAEYGYDGRGRRTLVDDPDLGKRELIYDATGNLLERRNPNGDVLRYAYDRVGRVLSEDWDDDGVPDVRNIWDVRPDNPADTSYRGRLVRVEDPSGSTEHVYDARGRITETRLELGGATYVSGSRFDAQDREYLHVYPDGSSLRIHRSPRGQIDGYGSALEFFYDADGFETERRFNTGVVQQSSYDADRRPQDMRVISADGSIIEHLRRTFDAAQNVIGIEDLRPNVTSAESRTEIFAHDDLYRLVHVAGSWGNIDWTWSPSGNLLSRTSSVAAFDAPSVSYGTGVAQDAGPHAPTKLGSRSLSYDRLGRLATDGKRTYTWNPADQLVRVSSADGASVDSVFDSNGLRRVRVERDAAGKETRSLFINLWSEVRDGQLVRYIAHGGQRIARLAPETGQPAAAPPPVERIADPTAPPLLVRLLATGQLFLLTALLATLCLLSSIRRRRFSRARAVVLATAALGVIAACSGTETERSPRIEDGTVQVLGEADTLLINDPLGSLLATATGTGKVSGRFATYPFGASRFDTTSETQLYTGAQRDRGVGLDLMGARSYAPDLGIWTIGDPLALTAPDKTVGGGFAAANPYAYAALSPLTSVDRDGNHPALIIIAAGALIGASVSSGMEEATQLATHGRVVSSGRIYAAAVGGGVAGAFTGGVGGYVYGTVARVALGASANVVQSATTELVASGGKTTGTPAQTLVAAGTGALGSGIAITMTRGASTPQPKLSGCNGLFCWGTKDAAGWRVKSPKEQAEAWQGKGDYPGVDQWENVTLCKGTRLCAGEPGVSGFFITEETVESVGRSRSAVGQGSQVKPHKVEGLRRIVGIYEITQDTPAARSTARANTQYGDGGLEQFFVPDWETSTTRVGEIQLVDP